MTNSVVIQLEEFDSRVITASHSRPILVDFWADWCGPCRVLSPILEQLIREYAGVIGLAKLEVDAGDNMKLAGRYQVRGFPTVILFINGNEADRFSGAQSKVAIMAMIAKHLGPKH
ncbi:MAG: thioredoxin [Gammaproteobacteria bacterium]|nr:thioredoxin [Gammaproteobacteria bacterium]